MLLLLLFSLSLSVRFPKVALHSKSDKQQPQHSTISSETFPLQFRSLVLVVAGGLQAGQLFALILLNLFDSIIIAWSVGSAELFSLQPLLLQLDLTTRRFA